LNVGSIARTCVCTGVPLHIIGTPGFFLDSRLAKRAGLDYWEHADVHVHLTWDEFESRMTGRTLWLFSTKGEKVFWDAEYGADDVLVFGSESAGLPEGILASRPGHVLRVPMVSDRRSLNLANVVAVGLYEALRKAINGKTGHGG
jgi:tRNA (cytidine/uridine-2'-O-)-methyltransferase